jgi:hypothetical protein
VVDYLAGGDFTKWEAVLKMSIADVFTKLIIDSTYQRAEHNYTESLKK